MKHLQNRIAAKTLHLYYNGEEHPMIINDPQFVIYGNDKRIINNESKDLELRIKQMLKAYSSKLSFKDKISLMNKAGTIKYQLFKFERYKEDVAFTPEVPLLDSLFHFCRENNCYDILENTIYLLIDYYIYSEKIRALAPGVMKIIKCEPDISFVWHNQWYVDYIRREDEKG